MSRYAQGWVEGKGWMGGSMHEQTKEAPRGSNYHLLQTDGCKHTHCNNQDVVGNVELAACVLPILTLERLAVLTGDGLAYRVHIYTLRLQVVALQTHTSIKHSVPHLMKKAGACELVSVCLMQNI